MKLSKHYLTSPQIQKLDFEFSINEEDIKKSDLIVSSEPLHVYITSQYISLLTILKIKVTGNLILKSTRTLKDVSYKLDLDDDFTISYESNDDDIYVLEGDEFDLDEYLTSLILSSLPIQVIGENDDESLKGDGWEIISEEEYYNRFKNNSPFKDLSLEFDDDQEN